ATRRLANPGIAWISKVKSSLTCGTAPPGTGSGVTGCTTTLKDDAFTDCAALTSSNTTRPLSVTGVSGARRTPVMSWPLTETLAPENPGRTGGPAGPPPGP